MLKYTDKILPNKQQESAYGDGRPTCNRVLTSGSVDMGIPMGIPMGILVSMGWVWGLKCHPQGSPAYRTGHSTETALLEILDGVYTAADDKQISVLIGLDLSAAFDTVDHSLMLERLHSEFAVTDTSLH